MIVKCGWCNIDMGVKKPLENRDVSHGMCKSCYDKCNKKINKETRQWKQKWKKKY